MGPSLLVVREVVSGVNALTIIGVSNGVGGGKRENWGGWGSWCFDRLLVRSVIVPRHRYTLHASNE